MALLTKTGMTKILRRIMESGGMTEDMEKDIERLQRDFDEREGILKMYGETYDGEDKEEYEFKKRVVSELTPGEDAGGWKNKYEEMKQRYLDRFFGGEQTAEDTVDIMKKTADDVKRDGEPQTFDELLERTEG